MADNLGTPTFSYTVTAPPNARSASSVDRAGNVYVADAGKQCIRLVTPRGVVTTMAATPGGAGGFADGPEAEAQFKQPRGAAVHEAGVVCVADTLNHRIRRVSPDG